ncbi:MAG: hypothetical protein N2578_02870 [Bdellovibrionaceae bacterium]|nr:hypothetical protein [Pseudobdellovibrionaceae bacterium]
MLINKYIFLITLFFLCSCSSQQREFLPVGSIVYYEAPADFKIPTALWEEILNPFGEVPSSELTKRKIVTKFTPVEIRLTELSRGVLQKKEIGISVPRGSASIDFAQFLGPERGSFALNIRWPEIENPDELRIWFFPRARQRRIDGEVYGSGCNKFYELNKKFKALMNKEGLRLNTTRDRHATVMSGHLIFVKESPPLTILGQITFTDSRRSELLCAAEGS